MIEKLQATVYFGGGRRWFTLRAACRAAARAKIKTRCDCDDETHNCCPLHESDRYPKIVRRLARLYKLDYIRNRAPTTEAAP